MSLLDKYILPGLKPAVNPGAYGCNGRIVVSVTLAGNETLYGSGDDVNAAVADLMSVINKTHILTCNGCGMSMSRDALFDAGEEMLCVCEPQE